MLQLQREVMASSTVAVVATCNLNQWAMDFTGNLKRIRKSIAEAKVCDWRCACCSTFTIVLLHSREQKV